MIKPTEHDTLSTNTSLKYFHSNRPCQVVFSPLHLGRKSRFDTVSFGRMKRSAGFFCALRLLDLASTLLCRRVDFGAYVTRVIVSPRWSDFGTMLLDCAFSLEFLRYPFRRMGPGIQEGLIQTYGALGALVRIACFFTKSRFSQVPCMHRGLPGL